MTRIIAGRARGIRLSVPRRGTRPTSDRVRESLFAALEAAGHLDRARVLDLYAGTGALGLEALSRGATEVALVEKAAPAAAVATANAAAVTRALGVDAGVVRVHRTSVLPFVRSAPASAYDLALIDPPYDVTDADVDTVLRSLAPGMAESGLVVVERASRSTAPTPPDGFTVVRDRRHGDTRLFWLERTPTPEGAPQPPTASQSE